MKSVTARIKEVKQPRGGYIKPKDFVVTQLHDNNELCKEENIHCTLMGIVVDYMTRFMLGTNASSAFIVSLRGAMIAGESEKADSVLNQISGLDDESIHAACKLVGYDVCARVGVASFTTVDTIDANSETINNVRIMVNRSLEFFKQYGPITHEGFNFIGGYTKMVSTGDGDFLTNDTLWDFKVSKSAPTTAHTLQLLMYYLMGKKSIKSDCFKDLKKLGVFNPRLNKVYLFDIENISDEVIKEVSKEVIGY